MTALKQTSKWYVIRLWDKFIASFDNHSTGMSARKLSAFAGVMIAAALSYKFTDATTVVDIVRSWLAFALLCLGIITWAQIQSRVVGPTPEQPQNPQQ
jgi:hypothetical protein